MGLYEVSNCTICGYRLAAFPEYLLANYWNKQTNPISLKEHKTTHIPIEYVFEIIRKYL